VSTSARGHERLSAQVPVEGRSVRQAGKALLKERYIGSPSAEPVCSRTMRSEEGKRAISTRRQPALELGAVIFVVWSSNKVTRITAKPPGLSSRHDSYATQRNLTIAATTSRTAPVNSIASSYASSPKPLPDTPLYTNPPWAASTSPTTTAMRPSTPRVSHSQRRRAPERPLWAACLTAVW
jgi:hypothetical protein